MVCDSHSIGVSFDPNEYRQVPDHPVGRRRAPTSTRRRALLDAACPMILAGQGIFYAEATEEFAAIGRAAAAAGHDHLRRQARFSGGPPIGARARRGTFTGHGRHFPAQNPDLVLGVGCSFTKHGIATPALPPGKKIIHVDENDNCRYLHMAFAADLGIFAMPSWRSANSDEAVSDRLNERRALMRSLGESPQ